MEKRACAPDSKTVWQIVPEALPRLMAAEDKVATKRVMQAMLQMRKIDIAALDKETKIMPDKQMNDKTTTKDCGQEVVGAGASRRRQSTNSQGRRRRPRTGLHRGHVKLEKRLGPPLRCAHRVRKATKWNSHHGIDGQGWFLKLSLLHQNTSKWLSFAARH